MTATVNETFLNKKVNIVFERKIIFQGDYILRNDIDGSYGT